MIQKPSDGYIIEYPKVLEFEDFQQDYAWTAKEIDVEADINDLRVNCTEAEKHGILHVLKLFTHYELKAGTEWWGRVFPSFFPRVEFARLGAQFAQVELCVHAPFYNKINEALMINTPEFYNSWKYDEVLKERMEFIDHYLANTKYSGLLALAVFSVIEGAILYSSFAFLKSFKKQGKNVIPNIVSGINFSVRDEKLHSDSAAWVFRTALMESSFSLDDIKEDIFKACKVIYLHECRIVDQIFSKGAISGITPHQLKAFVAHRVATCIQNLGLTSPIIPDDTSIQGWFYDDVSGMKSTDHFATLSSNYSRNWKEEKFSW